MMRILQTQIEIARGDITELNVDALVCPATTRLAMDQGLASLIAKKAGAAVEEEALAQAPVDLGDAVMTKAGNIKARHLIHAVISGVEGRTDQETLRHAAAGALDRAGSAGVKSLAFSALGCGPGGVQPEGAAKIMVQEIIKFCKKSIKSPGCGLDKVVFCLHDDPMFQVFDRTIRGYWRHLQEDLGLGPYVTVDIIIERPEGIVLVERSNPPYGWALPGGFVDDGESLETAAMREAKEETHLDLINLRQFHTYSEPGRDPRFNTVSTVYIAEGQGAPRSGDDAKSLKIVGYDELMEMDYAFDHKEIIKEYLIERDLE